ncbi:MAG: cytochrome P450, partial [Crocinitomicaceae bacterium]|nr:cytochrome P450 [Crocinitomicaceae bacterium]
IVNANGKPKAYSSICPHQGADLSLGSVEDGNIVCAMHQMAFSCSDGKSIKDKKCLVPYPIIEKEGTLYIDSKHFENKNPDAGTNLRHFKDLPSPKGRPIVGHLIEFKTPGKHQVLEKWADEVGPVYRISLAGKKIMVSGDPDLNLKIQKQRPHNFRRYAKIQEIMEEMGIYGTFSLEGDQWAMHRKLTTDALSQKNVTAYFPTTIQMTKRLHQRWLRLIELNNPVDVQKEMMRYTVDITTSIAFGYDGNTLDTEGDIIQNHLDKIFPMINKRMASPIPFWRFIKSRKDKELDVALGAIRATIQKYIDEAKEKLAEDPALKLNPTNFLEALLVEQEKEEGFSDKDVYGNVFTILLAGEDTTSNSIAWALYLLALNPECLLKAQKEIDALNLSRSYIEEIEDLSKLPYIEGVIDESMRLKTVGPVGYSQAIKDTVINDYVIKKDTVVFMISRVYQTSKDNFGSPKEFIPERWMDSSPKCPVPHSPDVSRPFGGGPRFCPGKALAIQEIKMALVMICKNFDLELAVKANEVREISSFTMYPENLMLNLSRRKEKVLV